MPFVPLWAIHIGDVLSLPVVLAGFGVIAVLCLIASRDLKEEDIPRVALLAAAFFVASSIHVKVPPTSVHLLLNGLIGVLLGWRAPLAILCGVTMQALLIGHGGISAIGVNATVQAIPALLAGGLFHILRIPKTPWMRRAMMATSALLWGATLVFGLAILWTQPLAELVRWTSGGLVLGGDLGPAFAAILHPASLVLLVGMTMAGWWLAGTGEFAAGMLAGVMSVIGALLLAGTALLLDGAEKWGTFVSLVFVAHMPLALVEGVVTGLAVSFLARVKPTLLGVTPSPAPVAIACILFHGAAASAHGLETEFKVMRTITVTVSFETGDAPRAGRVKVLGPGGEIVAEGKTDSEGRFTFSHDRTQRLTVQATAEGGHLSEFTIEPGDIPSPRSASTRPADLMAGLAFVLSLAAFVMACLRGRPTAQIENPAA